MTDLYLDEQFEEFLKAGELRLQRCSACERYVYYPRAICPHCGGAELAWEVHPGHGTVYSTTTIRRRAERGGDYDLSLIDLGADVRLMSHVVDIEPGQVRIGMPVQARIITADDGPLLVFQPTEGESA